MHERDQARGLTPSEAAPSTEPIDRSNAPSLDRGARCQRRMKNVMAPTSATTPRVDPTDAATIVVVETEEAELSVDGYPASRAADAAMRSYKHTGSDGVVLDMAQRTSLLLVSQLKTFWADDAADASQSGSHAPHSQSQPSLEP